MKKHLKVMVNGVWREGSVAPDLSLLSFLRDDLRLTGAKNGCGKGQCGACTVVVEGRAVASCTQKAWKLDGKRVETIEGLSSGGVLHPVQEAFLAAGAVQCGFCTPGMVLAAKVLLERTPWPSDREIKEGLASHLCRCTGYVKIIEAVRMAAGLISREGPRALSARPHGRIPGDSLPDIDGPLKVAGTLVFAGDISIEAMGYGAIVWSGHPHGEIVSIDIGEAARMEGVRRVLTGLDVPGRNRFGLFQPDQPVLAMEKVRFLGDAVALVIADSEEAAQQAARMVRVEYRVLEGVFSPREALKPGAPAVHEGGNLMRQVLHVVGDVARGLAQSDIIIENDYTTPFVDHAFLELNRPLPPCRRTAESRYGRASSSPSS